MVEKVPDQILNRVDDPYEDHLCKLDLKSVKGRP